MKIRKPLSTDRPPRSYSTALLEAEFGNSPEATWLVDPEVFSIRWANAAALKMWRSPDIAELRARDYQSDMSPAAKARVSSYRRAVTERGRIIERWTFYPEGKPVTLACSISALVDQEGVYCLLAQAFSRGTLDRIGLREEETLRYSGVLISAYDEEGRLLLRNPAAATAFLVSDRSIADHFADPEQGLAVFRLALTTGDARADLRALTLNGPRWHRVTARRGTDPENGRPLLVITEVEVDDIAAIQKRLQESQRLYRQLNEIVLEMSREPTFRQGQLDPVARLLEDRIVTALLGARLFVGLPDESESATPVFVSNPDATIFPVSFSTTMRDLLSARQAVVLTSLSGDHPNESWPLPILDRAESGALLASGIWNGHALAGVLLLRLRPEQVAESPELADFVSGIADQLSTLFVNRHRQLKKLALDQSRADARTRHETRELSSMRIDEQLNMLSVDESLAVTLGLSVTAMEGLPLMTLFAEVDRPIMLGHLNRVRVDPTREHVWRGSLNDADDRLRSFEISAKRHADQEHISLTLAAEAAEEEVAIETAYEEIYDVLTGALNRREMESRLAALSASRTTYVLIYFNIDNFRNFNTLGGIALGDKILARFGQILRELSGRRNSVGRVGADEFVVAMLDATSASACEFARRVQQSLLGAGTQLLAHFPETMRFRRIQVCAGVTPITDPETSELAAIGSAFGACLDAKAIGPGTLNLLDTAQMSDLAPRGVRILPRVLRAIEDSSFDLFIEPIVQLRDGKRGPTPRWEVLLRMRNPDGSMLVPGLFLPDAERRGLMPDIDRWVVSELSRLLCANPQLDTIADRWHINVSAKTMSDPHFAEYVAEHFKTPCDEGLRRLCFEITETAAVENIDLVRHTVKNLRQLGGELAIDDFGVGQANYDYLRQLGVVDMVKIDGSFVRRLPESAIDRAIVKSIVEVGAAFGIATIAEFVENDAIEAIAIELGVGYLQGYAMAKPKPILSLLATHAKTATKR